MLMVWSSENDTLVLLKLTLPF